MILYQGDGCTIEIMRSSVSDGHYLVAMQTVDDSTHVVATFLANPEQLSELAVNLANYAAENI